MSRLTSILASHQHSLLTSTKVRYHLHPAHNARHLSIQFPSQLQPGLDVSTNFIYVSYSCISRSLDSRLTYIHVVSHLNPCPDICDSPPPRWCLSSTQVPRISSQFHPCPISNPSRSQDICLTYIQTLPHLNPGLKILVSAPSMYFLNSIQAQKMLIKSTQAHFKLILVSGSVVYLSCLTSI